METKKQDVVLINENPVYNKNLDLEAPIPYDPNLDLQPKGNGERLEKPNENKPHLNS